MKIFIHKPHLLFLIAIPIIILMGILSGDTVLDFNVYDTYYIISHLHLAILISFFFGIIGIGYWFMQKVHRKLSKWIIWTHIVLTFGGMFLVAILAQFYRTEFMEYEFNNNLTTIITLIILVMIVVQLIFPVNIIYGLIKKKNKIRD